MTEQELEELMKSDAYRFSYHPDHKETQDTVRNEFDKKYSQKWLRNDIYRWKTVGDGKVRGSHASRDGQIFYWDNPPEGGHPGEAPNCRCVAEGIWEERNPSKEYEEGIAKREKERKDKEKAKLNDEIEKEYKKLDISQSKIDKESNEIKVANQKVSQLSSEINKIYIKIKDAAIEGAQDGAQGASDATGDAASLLEIVLGKEGIDEANTVVGAAAGAVGVSIAEYNDLKERLEELRKERDRLEKDIEKKTQNLEKLMEEREIILSKINELERKLLNGDY